jgi:hypothetical protein
MEQRQFTGLMQWCPRNRVAPRVPGRSLGERWGKDHSKPETGNRMSKRQTWPGRNPLDSLGALSLPAVSQTLTHSALLRVILSLSNG